MNAALLKPNQFIVKNGKLAPRPTTPEQKKNYRYIPFCPLNRPSPQDYFRETIYQLQQENAELRKKIEPSCNGSCNRTVPEPASDPSEQQLRYQNQILLMKQQLYQKQLEIQEKNFIINNKDKQLLEAGNQNSKLRLRIDIFIGEVEALNSRLNHRQSEIEEKNYAILEYCRMIENFAQQEKEEKNTQFSEHCLTTPKIEEYCEEEEQDQFYSIEHQSSNGRSQFSKNRLFMTPEIQPYRECDENSHLFRSNEEKPGEYFSYCQQDEGGNAKSWESRSSSSSKSSDLSQNLKNWSEWAGNNKISTLDFLKEEVDPVVGGLRSWIPGYK